MLAVKEDGMYYICCMKDVKIRCKGVVFHGFHELSEIKQMCQEPLLAPGLSYEIEGGFRNDVIFPGGMVLEDSGEVKIYYGAADTVECLANAHVYDLIRLCLPDTK